MPPRFAYWTIIAGGLPTAFRTAEREELLPTFRRIQEKHPDAEMKYFARGRLWASVEEARAAADARRLAQARQREGDRKNTRGRDWRPGGDHRDPRQKFADAKKARNLERRRQRFQRRERGGPAADGGSQTKPAPSSVNAPRQRSPRPKAHGDSLPSAVQREPARGRRPYNPGRTRPSRPRPSRGRR